MIFFPGFSFRQNDVVVLAEGLRIGVAPSQQQGQAVFNGDFNTRTDIRKQVLLIWTYILASGVVFVPCGRDWSYEACGLLPPPPLVGDAVSTVHTIRINQGLEYSSSMNSKLEGSTFERHFTPYSESSLFFSANFSCPRETCIYLRMIFWHHHLRNRKF